MRHILHKMEVMEEQMMKDYDLLRYKMIEKNMVKHLQLNMDCIQIYEVQ